MSDLMFRASEICEEHVRVGMIADERKLNRAPRVDVRWLLTALALLGLTGAGVTGAVEETKLTPPTDELEAEEILRPVLAERAAAEAVWSLGGWYELDADRHVVEVNMVYHEDPSGRRQYNDQETDEVLAHLPNFPQLKRLFLNETQASDKGLAFVGRLPQLEQLCLWNARMVSDDGVAHLRGLARLKELKLSNSSITDVAMLHLSKIASIESLVMQDNAFTDPALEYAARLPRLKTLIVNSKARFTDEEIGRASCRERVKSSGSAE